MRRRTAVLLLLAGCATDGADVELIAEPFTYRLSASEVSLDMPLPEQTPTVYIDGVATATLEESFDSFPDAAGRTHRIELRYGDTVIDRTDLAITNNCDLVPSTISSVDESLCVLRTGELRYGSASVDSTQSICTADGFCAAHCWQDGTTSSCPTGQHCTARVTSRAPLATKAACAPYGPRPAGATCELLDDASGAYSDCSAGLLCVDGTCAALAHGGATVPGYPPELTIEAP